MGRVWSAGLSVRAGVRMGYGWVRGQGVGCGQRQWSGRAGVQVGWITVVRAALGEDFRGVVGCGCVGVGDRALFCGNEEVGEVRFCVKHGNARWGRRITN